MKHLYIILFVLLLVAPASAEWLNLTPTIDSFVINYDYNNSNYGSSETIIIQSNSEYPYATIEGLYHYDLSSLPYNAVIISATLYNYISTLGNNSIDAYYISSAWSEYSVTWNNKPTYGSHIFTLNTTSTGYVTNDVTTIVTNLITPGSSNYGFVLRADTVPTSWYILNSREVTSNKPYLNISYTTVPGSVISGMVYELRNGMNVPISGANVRVWDNLSTASYSTITGSSGTYSFTGLNNNATYYVQAISAAGYDNSAVEIVTVGENISYSKNILLKKTEPIYFEPNKMYVNFWAHYSDCPGGLCAISNTPYNVYEGEDTTAIESGYTDDDGLFRLELYKSRIYRVTLTNSTSGLSYSKKIFITSDQIELLVDNTSLVAPNMTIPDNTNLTNVSYKTGAYSWSLSNLTQAGLNSSIGLGIKGQGILVGIISWVVVGAGGVLTTIFMSGLLVWLGILNLGTVVFFILTAVSIWYLKGQ